MEKMFAVNGNVRKDCFGRIVIDGCESDSEHLTRPLTPQETERQLCRHLIESAFEEFVGKKGTIILNIQFNEAPGDSIEAAVQAAAERR